VAELADALDLGLLFQFGPFSASFPGKTELFALDAILAKSAFDTRLAPVKTRYGCRDTRFKHPER
jgi:hypothetical protein